MLRSQEAGEAGKARGAFALVAAGALGVAAIGSGLVQFELPWFQDGQDEAVPHGSMTYEGQQVTTAQGEFILQLGEGVATVSVKARQNHDKPGGWFSGDFQGTNGTSSVRDPEDHDSPAALLYDTEYCSTGYVETRTVTEGEEETTTAVVHMGEMFVCDVDFRQSDANNAAFDQDDTDNDFHGNFETFITEGGRVTVEGAPCPTEDLGVYQSTDYLTLVQAHTAERLDIPFDNVEVIPGTVGETSDNMQDQLHDEIESFVNAEDPENPGATLPALDISYLSSDAEAVEDSCYWQPDTRAIDSLDNFDPEEVLEPNSPVQPSVAGVN